MKRGYLFDRIRALIVNDLATALEYCDGNKTRAAKKLGVPLRTIRGWIKQMPELARFHRHANGATWAEMQALEKKQTAES